MDLGLQGKRAVITGASKGIGRAIAETLAAEGCNLELVARSEAMLSELAGEISKQHGVEVGTHALDLSQAEQQTALAQTCAEADILVNNAGAIPSGELDTFDSDAWAAAWQLKVFGYVQITRQFYNAMKARGAGVIVNIIGAAGVKPDASYIAGSTGNAGLIAFTKALGGRSVKYGVRVVGINPSLTDTPRAQGILEFKAKENADNPNFRRDLLAGLPFGRMATAEEIAAAAAFLASPQAGYMSGTVIDIDGGLGSRS